MDLEEIVQRRAARRETRDARGARGISADLEIAAASGQDTSLRCLWRGIPDSAGRLKPLHLESLVKPFPQTHAAP